MICGIDMGLSTLQEGEIGARHRDRGEDFTSLAREICIRIPKISVYIY